MRSTGDSDSDDSSDLSDSEDFLTHAREGNDVDREALVRKKLLENFYGKSAAAAVATSQRSSRFSSFDSSDDDDAGDAQKFQGVSDLDSSNFDAVQHTVQHVQRSSLHTLLETEEQLSLQTRTLDSTMQTLVYENYSRFIDATDAIKSIGVNVSAHTDGLEQLGTRTTRIKESFGRMESSLGTLRDQVAEKIRVQRLLSRLDALLKLPQTLRHQISQGHYFEATQAHFSAVAILSLHSDSFESLQRIETECREILAELQKLLTLRLLAWSGHVERIDMNVTAGDSGIDLPDPPEDMNEIFECAGTLALMLQEEKRDSEEGKDDSEVNNEADTSDEYGNKLSSHELETMSIAAASRHLDRLLDSHLIDVQEQRYETPMDVPVIPGMEAAIELATSQAITTLVPRNVLDAMLEAVTLFRRHFDEGSVDDVTEFVSESFGAFLMHVKGVLVEETHYAQENDSSPSSSTSVNQALQLLETVVQDLSTKLPDIGVVGAEYNGESFRQQASNLTSSLIRQRVDVQFQELRLAVARDCLSVFAERAIAARKAAILELEQSSAAFRNTLEPLLPLVKSTLNDCLQLVDDTIRNVLEASSTVASTTSSSSSMLASSICRQAVESSVRRFVAWLANVLQVMIGGGVGITSELLQAKPVERATEEEADDDDSPDKAPAQIAARISPTIADDISELDFGDGGGNNHAIVEVLDSVTKSLQKASQEGNASDFMLAIVELFRHGEKTFFNELESSIATHMGGKKKTRGLFPDTTIAGNANTSSSSAPSPETGIGKCFHLAASQVLILYASNQGHAMGRILVEDLDQVASLSEPPTAPRPIVAQALELIKSTAIQCVELFGGEARAGPVPEMRVDSSPDYSLGARKTGIQLDVERMFMEKITVIIPHPSYIIDYAAARDSVLYVCCKIAFRAMLEYARMNTFSREGFQQVQVDVELLRLLLPHYLEDSLVLEGNNVCAALSNLLHEVTTAAGERCLEEDCLEDQELQTDSQHAVRSYIESRGQNHVFIIPVSRTLARQVKEYA